MNMMLEVIYESELRQPEYPMGEPQDFEYMKDFIQFNLEQIREARHNDPSLDVVAHKLVFFEYQVYECDDILYVKVRV